MITWFLATRVGKLLPAAVWKWLLISVAVIVGALVVQWRWNSYLAGVEQRGYDRANREWQARQDEANRKAAEEAAARTKEASDIAATTEAQAQAATVEVRTDTAATVERVRTVVRTVEVPAGCPISLPAVAQDELQRMVNQANEANR
jgi:hypothetical protein